MTADTRFTHLQGPMIKTCGLREPEHAVTAARAGADLIGMIFAKARRQISPEQAREIVQAAKHASSGGVLAVGVFVNASAAEMNEVIRIAGLDAVQLHGDEPADMVRALDAPAIKAMRPVPGATADDVLRAITPYLEADVSPVAMHFEGFAAAGHGGVGARADWELVSEVVRQVGLPVLLAGGLTPDNVGDAIAQVQPAGVDTSSGTERDGTKDHQLIQDFVMNARAAFENLLAGQSGSS